MRRFIITVLAATILHAVACIIAPPFEFGHNRTECFFFALAGGLFGFSLIVALVLWPLQWGLRRLVAPQATHPSRSGGFGAFGFGVGVGLYTSHIATPSRLLRSLVGLRNSCHCGHHFVFLAL